MGLIGYMLFSHFTISNYLKDLQTCTSTFRNIYRYALLFFSKVIVYDKVFNYSYLSYAKVIPANPDSQNAYI